MRTLLEWTEEIEVLSAFAVSQPHASNACYTHGLSTFLCRTIPNTSELFFHWKKLSDISFSLYGGPVGRALVPSGYCIVLKTTRM